MSKHEFVKWLKDFFVDVEWTDSIHNKVLYMAGQVERVREVTKVIEKPVIREKLVRVSSRPNIKRVDRYVNDSYLKFTEESGVKQTFVKQSLDDIAKNVCQSHGLTVDQLKSPCRKRNFVDARTCFVQHALAVYPYTLNELGEFLNRDHTTIIFHKNGREKL